MVLNLSSKVMHRKSQPAEPMFQHGYCCGESLRTMGAKCHCWTASEPWCVGSIGSNGRLSPFLSPMASWAGEGIANWFKPVRCTFTPTPNYPIFTLRIHSYQFSICSQRTILSEHLIMAPTSSSKRSSQPSPRAGAKYYATSNSFPQNTPTSFGMRRTCPCRPRSP